MRCAIWLIVTLFLGSGCSTTTDRIGPFKASYYSEASGDTSNQILPGESINITTGGIVITGGVVIRPQPPEYRPGWEDDLELVAAEMVARPALNYTNRDFHGINANHFRGVWEGDVELATGNRWLTINFNLSQADVFVFVDGILKDRWKNQNRSILLELDPGPHKIRIEYRNNWYTVGFNATFGTYPTITTKEAGDVFSSLANTDPRVIYIGVYGTKDPYNRILVSAPASDKPYVLFLSSSVSVNWILESPKNSSIAAVFMASLPTGSSVDGVAPSVPIYAVSDLEAIYNGALKGTINTNIQKITGKKPDYLYTEGSAVSVAIPEL